MNGNYLHNSSSRFLILDTRDSYVDSFTEFLPFCKELYFISNFKDFCSSALA
ncbi:MAG: hypothetical protein JST42_07840 [Bacteroidetes bacterium]|nr:hypothetical protein [Bacteroidota bacterium]